MRHGRGQGVRAQAAKKNLARSHRRHPQGRSRPNPHVRSLLLCSTRPFSCRRPSFVARQRRAETPTLRSCGGRARVGPRAVRHGGTTGYRCKRRARPGGRGVRRQAAVRCSRPAGGVFCPPAPAQGLQGRHRARRRTAATAPRRVALTGRATRPLPSHPHQPDQARARHARSRAPHQRVRQSSARTGISKKTKTKLTGQTVTNLQREQTATL